MILLLTGGEISDSLGPKMTSPSCIIFRQDCHMQPLFVFVSAYCACQELTVVSASFVSSRWHRFPLLFGPAVAQLGCIKQTLGHPRRGE